MAVKTHTNYVLVQDLGHRKARVRIEHWEDGRGSGCAAHIDAIEATTKEGYDSADLKALADLFAAAAKKLSELRERRGLEFLCSRPRFCAGWAKASRAR
jgi:hypothetical protein